MVRPFWAPGSSPAVAQYTGAVSGIDKDVSQFLIGPGKPLTEQDTRVSLAGVLVKLANRKRVGSITLLTVPWTWPIASSTPSETQFSWLNE